MIDSTMLSTGLGYVTSNDLMIIELGKVYSIAVFA
jgi:hypothetical protein